MRAIGKATLRDNASEEIIEIDGEDLEWELVASNEREMGTENQYQADYAVDGDREISWNVWEYPAGALNDVTTSLDGYDLVTDFEYDFEVAEFESSVDEIVTWFHEHYEDPAVRTPWESAEGGYQYIWGGPYDARDVIEGNWSNASQRVIDEAVERVEADGTVNWTSATSEPDYAPDVDDEDDNALVSEDGDFIVTETGERILTRDGSSDSDSVSSNQKQFSLPPQQPGIAFELTQSATIQIATIRRAPIDELPAVLHLRTALREVLNELMDALRGTNAYTDLRAVAQKYQSIVNAEDLNVDLLYAYGIRLENARTALRDQIDTREFPAMSPKLEEATDSVLGLHGTLIASTTRGKELLENARAYQQAHPNIDELKKVATAVATAIARDSRIIEHDAAETILEVNEEIGKGPHPERSTEVARTVNWNVLTTLGTLALGGLGLVVGEAVIGSIPGAEAITFGKTNIDLAWHFFVANQQLLYDYAAVAGPDMSWLRDFVGYIGRNKKRSK